MPRVRRRRNAEEGDPKSEAQQETGTVKAYRRYSISGELMSEDEGLEELEAIPFTVEPAYVTVSHSRTKNLGNFESAKIDVRVSVPCYPNEIDGALKYADTTAADFLDDVVQEYIEELT